ncbi:hypothetical protein [Tsukamurella paurometabola]|uniref:Lipoprotein n=1 Tax=Tsukamurella paurometabola TaxID=2061 RepID=A0A3P8MDC4_TSUPA|nr:hypothetical protein [Tsukamurella paurometabola]UEA83146.1 hypothetical protein LK411_22800 [Tsukamurella paurometabola]VDR40236.1 Uncharacterised protein [Tsukamurella paurometabola]
MNRSWARLPGCAVSVAAAAAVLAVFVFLVASCATFGDTTRQLDADGVRAVVKRWTGAALPESITVVTAQEYVSRDSSMYAVFDTVTGGLNGFLAQLGERTVRELAADCRDPTRPVGFREVPGSVRIIDAAPGSRFERDGSSGEFLVTQAVEQGRLDGCRAVVAVSARPTDPYVYVLIQAGGAGLSRVVLSLVYT